MKSLLKKINVFGIVAIFVAGGMAIAANHKTENTMTSWYGVYSDGGDHYIVKTEPLNSFPCFVAGDICRVESSAIPENLPNGTSKLLKANVEDQKPGTFTE